MLPYLPYCKWQDREKSCSPLESPDLRSPQPGTWHPLWGSEVPDVSKLLGATTFHSSRCGWLQQKLCALCLIQLQPRTELIPVLVPGAAHLSAAVSMPGCAQWLDLALTLPHTPHHFMTSLMLAGVGSRLVARAKRSLPGQVGGICPAGASNS